LARRRTHEEDPEGGSATETLANSWYEVLLIILGWALHQGPKFLSSPTDTSATLRAQAQEYWRANAKALAVSGITLVTLIALGLGDVLSLHINVSGMEPPAALVWIALGYSSDNLVRNFIEPILKRNGRNTA